MNEKADISVIIPSYNGVDKLRIMLPLLSKQTISGFEVIIVLDGSTDDSSGYLHNFDSGEKFRLKIVETLNGGRSVARNNGAKNASAPILIFIDDDMTISESLVQQHLELQRKLADTVIIGSNFRDPQKATIPFHQFLLSLERDWESDLILDGPVTMENFFFYSQNFSIPATIFQSVGGFDEQLRDAEDFDLGLRVMNNGAKIVYDSSIIAFHNDWPDLKGYLRRHNQYVAASQELARLRPHYLQHFPSLAVTPSSMRKRRILSWCRKLICPAVLRNGLLFRMLSQKMRFKLYRLTIAAYSDTNALTYSA